MCWASSLIMVFGKLTRYNENEIAYISRRSLDKNVDSSLFIKGDVSPLIWYE